MIIEAGRLCKHKEGSNPSIEAGPRGGAGESAAVHNASGGRSTAFRKSRYYGVISTGAMRKHRAAEKSLPMTYWLLRIVALFMKCGSSSDAKTHVVTTGFRPRLTILERFFLTCRRLRCILKYIVSYGVEFV